MGMLPTESSVKTVAAMIAVATAAATTLFLIDGRYAHADAYKAEESKTIQLINNQTLEFRSQNLQLRQSIIEDKIFELDTKRAASKLSPVEDAQHKRYSRQLDEVTRSLRSIPQQAK